MNQKFRRFCAGFTIIEMMIMLSLVLVVLSFGIPSLASFIKNSRVTTYTTVLSNDINLAHSEAVKRNQTTVLCRSANADTTKPSCGGIANTWTSGWLVFVDIDGNYTYDHGKDILLDTIHDLIGSVSIKSNEISNNFLIFKADGNLDVGTATAVFAICDDRGEGYGNQLQISQTGKPRVISPVPSTCNAPSV